MKKFYFLRRLSVVHPLLFALFPILALYAHNVAEVSPSEIVLPTGVVLGATLVLLLLLWLVLRNVRKAGLLVSIFVVLFFSYGHALSLIAEWDAANTMLLSIWGVLFVLGVFLTIRTRRDLQNLTMMLSIVGAILVIIPAINIVVHEIRVAGQDVGTADSVGNYTVDLENAGTLHDIYYIIMDRYPSESMLEEAYGFDNSQFIEYLRDRGFYVASASCCNYTKTAPSLASSLNMEYINYLTEEVGEDFDDWGPMYSMLQDYEVWRFLKANGYEFIHFGSWWWPTKENRNADMNIYDCVTPGSGNVRQLPEFYQLPEFSMVLFRSTMLYHIYLEFNLIDDERQAQWRRVLYKFDKLAEIPDIEEPTFVFAHFMLPHEPYVFDREGNYLTAEEDKARSREERFVEQLVFTNTKLVELIDELLASSEVPPIIILQADEAEYPPDTDHPSFKWEEASEAQLREKARILNAYYLPNANTDALYPSISPVNSFRLLFNMYFGTDFELLPDRSYTFYRGKPYKFLDITDKVKYD